MRIGIECHNLENQRWGIGRNLEKLLETIAQNPHLIDGDSSTHSKNTQGGEQSRTTSSGPRVFLYFKSFIPEDDFLKNPIFKCKILKLPFIRPSFNIFYHIFLPIQYFRDKLDLMFFPGYMLPAFFRGKSLVTLTNDAYYEYKFGSLPLRYKLGYGLFSRWAAIRATKISTFTEFAKNQLIKIYKIKPERIAVNPLGVELNQNNKASSFKLQASRYLLYIGQAFPRRRALESIVAFSKIAKKYPDLNFVVIGKDKYPKPILKELTDFLNKKFLKERIIYKEYVSNEELLQLYKNALAMVYISSSEAMGLPPIEILQYKIPSIIKRDGPGPELFGENAFYVENETDINEIAQVISQVVENADKKKQITENAESIVKKFNWQAHTEKFIKTIKEIIN